MGEGIPETTEDREKWFNPMATMKDIYNLLSNNFQPLSLENFISNFVLLKKSCELDAKRLRSFAFLSSKNHFLTKKFPSRIHFPNYHESTLSEKREKQSDEQMCWIELHIANNKEHIKSPIHVRMKSIWQSVPLMLLLFSFFNKKVSANFHPPPKTSSSSYVITKLCH